MMGGGGGEGLGGTGHIASVVSKSLRPARMRRDK